MQENSKKTEDNGAGTDAKFYSVGKGKDIGFGVKHGGSVNVNTDATEGTHPKK